MKKLALVLIGALAGLAAVQNAPEAREVAAAQRPNIIFFLVDDMSAELLDYMDQTRSLANDGTRFTNYIVSNSLCCPSRATMFTGEYPHNTGVMTNKGSDNGGYAAFREHEDRTYATALHDADYRTGYMGKYINEYKISGKDFHVPAGWDEWHAQGGHGYSGFNFETGTFIREQNVKRVGKSSEGEYLTDSLAESAVGFIERSRQHAKGRPFFLQVAPFSPHQRVPYRPGSREPRFPPAMRDRPADAKWPGAEFPSGDCGGPNCYGIDVTKKLPTFDEDTTDKPSWVRRKPLSDDTDLVNDLRSDFRDRIRMVQSVDDLVGEVLGTLTRAERDNTFIVFASDNGFHLGQHRLVRGKSTAYDHDARLPLLVKRPGKAFDGDVVRDEVVQNVDLFATFLEMAAVDPAVRDGRDGRSLLGLIRNEDQNEWRSAALIEHRKPNAKAGGDPDPDADDQVRGNSQPPSYRAIRTATELYVEYDNGEREYYDLAADPLQTNNIPQHPRGAELAGPLDALSDCGRGRTGCWAAAHLP